jgi:hypothetical protein
MSLYVARCTVGWGSPYQRHGASERGGLLRVVEPRTNILMQRLPPPHNLGIPSLAQSASFDEVELLRRLEGIENHPRLGSRHGGYQGSTVEEGGCR